MIDTIQKAPNKVDNIGDSSPMDFPREVACDHLKKEVARRRRQLKALEDRGEPVSISLIVEIDAFQKWIYASRVEK